MISSSRRTAPTRASAMRSAEAFGVDVDVRANKFVWLGTSKVFDAFTFAFEETEHGWIWAHAYRFAPDCSTFIVECSEETWRALRLRPMDQDESIAACERLFAKYLDGHALQSNASHLVGSAAWLNFRRIKCERWIERQRHPARRRRAHRAFLDRHRAPSSRSRTRSSSPRCSTATGLSLEAALDEYQAERNLEVLKLQNSARNSTEWFETLERYLHFEPLQFAYSLLTRSQRISHENLRLRDREWLEGVERWFWKRATDGRSNKTAPPMFAPFKLREMERREPHHRLADGDVFGGRRTPNDFHFVHLRRARAGRRGAGLHRDDLRLARRPDQPRLHRHVERRSCRRVEAHRRFRPRQFARRRSASSSAIRAARARPSSAGRATTSARRRQLAGDGGERRAPGRRSTRRRSR